MKAALPIALLSPCTPGQEVAQDPFVVETCDSGTLPGPERAAAAAARVKPELEQALKEKGLHLGDPVFLRAFKEENQLELWVLKRETGKYDLFRTWPVARKSGVLGPKLAEGDGQVPEGFYFVPRAGMKPDSTFHLAFNIGYPNEYDRFHERTGTFIMIHGNEVSIGCLAMTDAKIEEIYTLCDAALTGGQQYFRVHIFPFRMSAERLDKEHANHWYSFWQELKEGYDSFEKNQVPPEVTVELGRYRFK
ncbi:murein L,D-transpeptidase family protein [Haloferula sp. BvORR071]|uniref:L,D-transpeptidase family protein n=1 Tax=Haloferula sp. BvORR071 TaxID=1396141 RepID=UPI002240F0D4|nr:murein L,D-transpeptidase family protein [Haloferula sp. BvORR071]